MTMTTRWLAITLLLTCAACPAAPRSPMRQAPGVGLAKPRGPVLTERVITADVDAPRGVIVVGDRVAWIDGDRQVRTAPLEGGGSTTHAELEYISSLIAYKGDVLAIGSGLWRVPLTAGAKPTQLVEQIDAQAMALAGDTLVLASSGMIHKLQLTGGEASEPVELVADGGEITAVVVHAGQVYWADAGVKPLPPNVHTTCVSSATTVDGKIVMTSGPCDDEPRDGTIRRVPLAGGDAVVVADHQFGPIGIGVRGDQLYWSCDDGETLMRAPLAGGKPEVVLRGRGAELAVDDAGVVVLADSGLLVEEVAPGKAPRVRSTFVSPDSPLALAPTEIVTIAEYGKIIAIPRGESRLTVIASPRGTMDDLILAGGRLVYADTHRADDRDDRVISIGLRGEAPRVLARARGGELRIGSDGEHVVFGDVDAGTIWVDGGAPIVVDTNPLGVAIEGDTVYYTDGNEIIAVPRTGGPSKQLFTPPDGMGWGTSGGPPEVQISVERGVVHASAFPLPGLVRADAAGAEVLLENIDRFATIPGGGGYVVYGQDVGLFTYPDKRTLLPLDDAYVNAIAVDAHDAWVLVYGADSVGELRRISLGGGPSETVVRGLGYGQLVVTDGAVYIRSGEHDVLLRLTR